MNERLVHRGPDDAGLITSGAVSLGARRLSIIDVGGGRQPVANEDETVHAVLNGEIYNHPELQERLGRNGHMLRSHCDTEVLVHLYEELGTDLVHALEGMYAFAIWDQRRSRLLLARDRFGEKPLFWMREGRELRFASELTALLAGAATRPQVDPAALDAVFVYGYLPGPRAMVDGVRQLEPGSTLVFSGGNVEVSSYWSLPRSPAAASESDRDLKSETIALLRKSVASRLLSDVPVGVLLSGGLDSSLVAALAVDESAHRIRTFSVGYGDATVDETDKARAVAGRLGSEHHELRLTDVQLADLAPRLLGGLDQPIADQALVAMHAVCELAAGHVKVVVGGEGADELFGGYPRYRWVARAAELGEAVPDPIARASAGVFAHLPGQARRLADVIRPQSTHERHLDWVTAGRRSWRHELYGERLMPLADSSALEDELQSLIGTRDGDVARALMQLDQRHWLPHDVLAKADRAGMLASVEVRTPFLDRGLAEFASGIPTARHLRGGGKSLLRAALAEAAPSLQAPPKTAFRVPAAGWLRGPLRPCLTETIEDGRLFTDRWFDRDATRRLADRHFAGEVDATATLWPVLTLGLWFERFAQASTTSE